MVGGAEGLIRRTLSASEGTTQPRMGDKPELSPRLPNRPPKVEKAALRWLERYLTEGSPRLKHFAEITAELARRDV